MIEYKYQGEFANGFLVPSDVTSLTVTAYGAQGGNSGSAVGGKGAQISAMFSVSPGDVFDIYIGGMAGYNYGGPGPTNSGANGVPGGGATDFRPAGGAVASRLLVAGGGGGAASEFCTANGGAGGCYVGGSGDACFTDANGGGGLQSAGGVRGETLYQGNWYNGTDGGLSYGGGANQYGGGGGGGGYYGGGGGVASAGGGGSSYPVGGPATCTGALHSGNGMLTIEY
ncbi:unnamed protein product, partial [Ectocarpus fasciculatus]